MVLEVPLSFKIHGSVCLIHILQSPNPDKLPKVFQTSNMRQFFCLSTTSLLKILDKLEVLFHAVL